MAIDINKFLDSILEEEKPEVIEEEVEDQKVTDLEFESDVKDKLSLLQKQTKSQNNSISFLEQAFNEIKSFDETLPNKFIGIDNQAEVTLKLLSEKYSQDFLQTTQSQLKIAQDIINNSLTQVSEFIEQEEMFSALKELEYSFKIYNKIPDIFFEEKQKISKQIKKNELNFLQLTQKFKEEKLISLKNELNKKILNIKNLLKPGNYKEVIGAFEDFQNFIQSFPKLYYSSFIEEKQKIVKFSSIVENYLENEYLREFDEKEDLINSLTEEFLSNNIQKNFNQALLIYNQILVEFDSLPNVFFQRKIALFQKVNELYSTLSKLIIKNNVSLFVDSYNFSKILEETRDYLNHIKYTKSFSKNTMESLLEKLNTIPSGISNEVENYKNTIKNLLENRNFEIIEKNNIKNISYKNGDINNNQKSNTFEEKNKKESDNNSSDFINSQDVHSKKLHIQKNLSVEINTLYKIFNKSDDKEQLKAIYKKLLFYINLLDISNEEKNKLISKVKSSLHKKRL